MAFTEAGVVAVLDSAATGRTITLVSYIPGTTYTDIYAVGVLAPYAGRERWCQVANSNTAAQAATAIQTVLST